MKQNIIKGASILSAILMLSVVMTPVLAAEVQPFNRWGYANDGAGPLDTQLITAWVDGVEFGSDITGTGGDIGLFSIDVFGDSTDSPTIKTGGWNGETVQYVHGDLLAGGVFFAETDSWLVGGFNTVAADLNEVASTPALLKISKISIAPVPFIGIYDSTGAATITDFALDINNGGAAAITAVDVLGTIGQTTYINPAAWGGISNDDALTLSEAATGFIVDRVEFGAINVEPQETTMNNAPNPATDFEITRTPALDTDTNDCLADFMAVTPPSWPGGVVTATATGPVGIGGAAVDITYITAGSPATVELFVSENGGNFVSVGIDNPADGLFPYVCPGVTGDLYDWIANVPGGDDDGVGIPGGPAEAGTWELLLGGPTTAWDIYNGQNFRTFSSDLTAGWDSEVLAVDVINYINTNYPAESLALEDVSITTYDSVTGLYTNCYYFTALAMWMNVYPLAEGQTYIVILVPGALITQPRSYELPNFEITTPVTVDIYNGQNFRGFPAATATDSELLAVEIIAYINTNYPAESLALEDVSITMYDSVTGLYTNCYYFTALAMWMNVFPLVQGEGYIVILVPGALITQPRAFTPS